MANDFVLAIDPGGLTGMSLIQADPLELLWSAEVGDNYDVGVYTQQIVTQYGDNVDVVIEGYYITSQTAKKSQQYDPLELIGQTKWICQWEHHAPPFKYSPNDAKNFSTNDRIKALELWHVGGEGHANDSIRHAVLHLVKTGWKDERLLKT